MEDTFPSREPNEILSLNSIFFEIVMDTGLVSYAIAIMI